MGECEQTVNAGIVGKDDHDRQVSSEMIPILSEDRNEQGKKQADASRNGKGNGSMPRFLEIEISPLLLFGVFSLSNTAKARREMERGYLKLLGKGAIDEAPQVSLSLPILHVDSSGGKRKKIIGWDKTQAKPLRLVIDSEDKTKPIIEYGIVGQDNKDTTPLGTVEIPTRHNHLGPRQLHLNLKNNPLWPINSVMKKPNNTVTKFRLSANARLSLRLNIMAGTEPAATHLENRAPHVEHDEQETKPSIRRTLQSIGFASLFRCFCANNEKEAVKLPVDSNLKPIKLSVPTSGMTIDADDNSLLENNPEKAPTIVMLSDEQKIVKVRPHSRAFKLPMSFSSTTGSLSEIDPDQFRVFFCYPLGMNDESSDDDSLGDNDSAPVKEIRDDVPRELPDCQPPQVELNEVRSTDNPHKKKGLLAALKLSISALKIRCASPRCSPSIDSGIAERVKDFTINDNGRDSVGQHELVEIESDDTNSVSTDPSGTGCMPFSHP